MGVAGNAAGECGGALAAWLVDMVGSDHECAAIEDDRVECPWAKCSGPPERCFLGCYFGKPDYCLSPGNKIA